MVLVSRFLAVLSLFEELEAFSTETRNASPLM